MMIWMLLILIVYLPQSYEGNGYCIIILYIYHTRVDNGSQCVDDDRCMWHW